MEHSTPLTVGTNRSKWREIIQCRLCWFWWSIRIDTTGWLSLYNSEVRRINPRGEGVY